MHAVNRPFSGDLSVLLDARRLKQELETPENALRALKSAVHTIDEGLQKHYRETGNAEEIVLGRAHLVDVLLNTLFAQHFADHTDDIALLAVGGYGRGELHPHSDIDLMLLLHSEEDEEMSRLIERFIMLLWDSRLEIGHSVRTVPECVAEASNDISVATNIMEARLLAGNAELFDKMEKQTAPDKIWSDRDFFKSKLKEQAMRNGKFNDTAYNLEPNIKEGHGGLRDIQMIGWVANRHFGASSLHGLVEHGFLLPEEYETLYEGQQLLWRIRCSLHFLSGRREDRLLFDYQRDIAREFGFEDDPSGAQQNQAIEQFMQQYYQTVMELERLNEMLLQHFREAILYADADEDPYVIDESFQVRHDYIEARHDRIFSDHPIKLLELFLCMEKHPEIQGVRAQTIRLIRKHRHLIDDQFRESKQARDVFIQIIRQGRGLTHELRRMNRYGILAAYLPAFGAIAGRMQYDLFHAFTVDQHTLFVIRNMRRLAEPEFCHEFPLASGISHHLAKPELLYIAGLFHDIAKGRGGDHSELGAIDAFEFCSSHGLNYRDSMLVSWLVSNHLVMSITAQRRDISDPEVITEFCNLVGDLEHLDYLYLLTMCDIRATNPKQWNSWKDNLLIELYSKSARLLQLGIEHRTGRQEEIDHNRTYALRNLTKSGISMMDVRNIWNNFTDDYFLRHKADEIIWHTNEMMKHPNIDTPLVKVRFDKHNGIMELVVYTRTLDHLFAKIVGVINQLGLNITDAFMMRCKNNCLIETFKIVFTDEILVHIEDYAREIVPQILERLASSDITDGSNISVPRVHKHFNVETHIHFDTTDDGQTTRLHIDTADRPGLLSQIARIFIDFDLRIHSAKVSTAGEKAVDYFDLTDKSRNLPLTDAMQNRLKKTLTEQL